MHGTFAWNELTSTDVEQAKSFYEATLGWSFEEFPIPEGRYWVATVESKYVAGLGGLEVGAIPDAKSSYWFSFIEVDDVDTRLASAVAHGAAVIRQAVDVPNVGRVAVLRDPTGAPLGWMTSVKPTAEEGSDPGHPAEALGSA